MRDIAATILSVLACFGVLASTIALWAGRTVLDSPTFAETAITAVEDPAVAEAVATFVSDEAVDLVWDLAGLDGRIPSFLEPYADSLDRAVRDEIRTQVTRGLRIPAVRQALQVVLERAHNELMRVVDSDGDEVRVNLLPVLASALLGLQDRGLLPGSIDVPTFDEAGDPADQIAELEDRLGRDLPDTFGQLRIYAGDAVSQFADTVQAAREAVRRARLVRWLTVAVTVGLAVAAVVASPDRGRALLIVGLGGVAAAGIGVLAISQFDDVLSRLANPEERAEMRRLASTHLGRLVMLARALALAGAAAIAVSLLTDPWTAARRGDTTDRRAARSPGRVVLLSLSAAALLVLAGWSSPVPALVAAAILAVGSIAWLAGSRRPDPDPA